LLSLLHFSLTRDAIILGVWALGARHDLSILRF
jgi:hypothetical protein